MKNAFALVLTVCFGYFSASCLPNNLSSFGNFGQLRSNLYIVAPEGLPVLMDGSLTQYYSDYSNELNGMDARKMTNPSENWGMVRNDKVYVIERRHTIENSDSIFFKMWNMRIITYRIELEASGMSQPGRQAFLKDKFLETTTPVNLEGTTYVDFSVTSNPASKAAGRFMLVFYNQIAAGILGLTFTEAKATEKNNQINIGWKTADENNIKQFDIEKSSDRIHFTKSGFVKAQNAVSNTYHWVDAFAVEGNNYYRVCSIDRNGKSKYSKVMEVYNPKAIESFSIYPNPATGHNLNLKIINQKPGKYMVSIMNAFGQLFLTKEIQYEGGISIQKIQPSQPVPKGIYQLIITPPEGAQKVRRVVF